MPEKSMQRILFAAPKSGSGKTLVTCGVIELLKRKKLSVASFKCGPDYIDPMFHRRVLGIPSGNLDTFFTGEETTRYLLSEQAGKADITVLEGVMGYYDGLLGQSEQASTYEIAKVTQTPVVLVLDAKGASVSLAAVAKGIIEYRKDSGIRGILLNRVSAGYYERLKELLERECSVKVLGYIPELTQLAVPQRHLGLVSPDELRAFEEWIGLLADTLEKTVDINALCGIAKQAAYCTGKKPELPCLNRNVRIAVARDEAFSFYYTENLELLGRMGAELVPFSPLHDTALPQDIDGLLLGGGYPENFAKELEEAEAMRASVREACRTGIPCLAECGGFLYLQQELEGTDGSLRRMAGVLDGQGFRTKHLTRFGYIEAECRTPGLLGDAGQSIRGHEFHYWDCTQNGTGFTAIRPARTASYPCMVHTGTIAAGFPHFYYYSNPDMAWQFLCACARFQAGRLAKKHWDGIAKPIDSLGLLEDHVVRICRMTGNEAPYDLKKRALIILCGDHGVVKEGVTQTGSGVTRIVSENFAHGCSTVNYMAASAGADVFTVDVGMDTPNYPEKHLVPGAVIDRKISRGCGNIAREPAMTADQCRTALNTGMELVRELKKQGYRIIATGEMGIGNTTPTSALAALFLNQPPELVTGKGAGLSSEGIRRKCRVVEQTIKRIRKAYGTDMQTDPAVLLAEAGGYEIAAMAGVFLGGAASRIPIVIDGAISSVAALAAMKLDPRSAGYMIASHESQEITGKLALKELGAEAILHGRMCLGEGTGAVAVFPLLDMAMEVYRNMGTFTEYKIEPYTRFDQTKEPEQTEE